jgi:hypothetical protein
VQVGLRRVRHVVDERLARHRQQPVADEDLLGRLGDLHGRHVGEAVDPHRADEAVLVAEDLAGLGDQRLARPVDVPAVAELGIEPDDVDLVAFAADDAVAVAPLDDLGRVASPGPA